MEYAKKSIRSVMYENKRNAPPVQRCGFILLHDNNNNHDHDHYNSNNSRHIKFKPGGTLYIYM